MSRRYLLTYEYDGSAFKGWQKQPDVRTAEGVAEEALSILFQQEIDLIGQGRTDAGVHARNQTAHADLPEKSDSSRAIHAMKGLLPNDIALKSMIEVADDFHARFHATARSYSYTIVTNPAPLLRHTVWQHYGEFDKEILQKCAEMIKGEHNFINFCIPPDEEMMTTISEIRESRWTFDRDHYRFEITGSRFLRHMVRRLVGSMVHTASGKITIDEFRSLLESEEQSRKAHAAPASGLILEFVHYDGIEKE